MSVTLQDVAALAGVSVKTVSNVVNNLSFVTEVNRRKVQDAIAATGYRPNMAARNLRRGRTGFLALVVPELGLPYFGELASLVIAAAHVRGWTVLVEQTFGTRAREQELLAGLGAHMVDGAIVSPEAITDGDLAHLDPGFPIVLLGEHELRLAIDHVGIDNVRAARDAVDHLVAGGARRIAAIGDLPRRGTAAQRMRGYEEALTAAGLGVSRDLVVTVEHYHRADGARAMDALLALDAPPDAVFCLNDQLAIGALHRVRSAGLTVPGDIAVMGFDGSEEAAFSNPSLSTVAPDKGAIAREAVDLVARRLGQHGGSALVVEQKRRKVEVAYELLVRETTHRRPAVDL